MIYLYGRKKHSSKYTSINENEIYKRIKNIVYSDFIRVLSFFTSETINSLKNSIKLDMLKFEINSMGILNVKIDIEKICDYFKSGNYSIKIVCNAFEKHWHNTTFSIEKNSLNNTFLSSKDEYANFSLNISNKLQEYMEKVLQGPESLLITVLSCQNYEKKESCGSFAFLENASNINLDLKFDRKVELDFKNIRQCRKVLESSSTSKNKELVFLSKEENSWFMVGLINPDEASCMCKINIKGKSSWELTIPKYCITNDTWSEYAVLQYKNGMYGYPSNRDLKKYDFFNKISKTITDVETDVFEKLFFISKIAESSKKGTILIFTNDHGEIDRLKAKKLGTNINKINLYEAAKKNNNIIANMCSVDGALIIDELGNCSCYGVILDGEAIINGDSSTGSRHNSAKNYIIGKKKSNPQKGYLAVVISDDNYTELY